MRKFLLALGLAFGAGLPAAADSCWMHNGSLMRLQADGAARWFSYETPRAGIAAVGVRRGTLLFNGRNDGGWYSGLARVFSSACPGEPLEYYVEGPVSDGQRRVTLRGTREVHRNCQPTGDIASDVLVFTYSHQC
jgi:hypothetical protein